MKLVCLDTSGRNVVVALCDTSTDSIAAGTTVEVRAQGVLAILDATVRAAGWQRSDIDAIAVGIGPGGFTGVRVGVATARGLAEALDVPLHGVASLAALVASDASIPDDATSAWAVLDARRGEHFAQRFERDAAGGEWRAASPPSTRANGQLEQLDGYVVTLTSPTPSGLAIAGTAAVRAAHAAGQHGDALTVTPEYVRAPDAEPPRPRLRLDDMQPSDVAAVLGIEARSFPTPWSAAMYEEELRRCDSGNGVALVARDLTGGARVVGAVLAAWMGDSWHVMNVLVDPPARRRGIGAQLLDLLLERTATHPLGVGEGWTLEVREGNDAAIGLYESRSFVNRGRRPGYYSDTGEAALIMWRAAPVPEPASGPSPTPVAGHRV